MSWDIYLSAHQDGEMHHFPLSVVLHAFGPAITYNQINETTCTLILEYANPDAEKYGMSPVRDVEINMDIIIAGDEIMTGGFCVNRPPSHDAFWESLYVVISHAQAVLYWGADEGEQCMAIGRAETERHLPQGMRDALGDPVLVKGYEDILALIKS